MISDIIWALLLGLTLCFDTFAVSVSGGISKNRIVFKQALRVAFVLAFFQTLMPFLGYLAGKGVQELISSVDHWVSFGLLSAVAGKMMWEVFQSSEEESKTDIMAWKSLITVAIATSIDAFAVGITLGLSEINIWLTLFIIGFCTGLTSMLGLLLGKNLGHRFGKRFELVGALILLMLGIKILMDHQWGIQLF